MNDRHYLRVGRLWIRCSERFWFWALYWPNRAHPRFGGAIMDGRRPLR